MSILFAGSASSRVKTNNPQIMAAIDGTRQFTLCAWVFTTTAGTNVFIGGPNTGAGNMILGFTGASPTKLLCRGNTNINSSSNQTIATGAGVWNHIAGTYNGNTDQVIHLYLNGVECTYASQNGGAWTPQYPNSSFYFGGTLPAGQNFSGALAEVAIFKVALSAAQIAQIAASTVGLNPKSPGWIDGNLLAYYHLNGQTATEVDSTGNVLNVGVPVSTAYKTDSPGYSFTAGQPATPLTSISQQGVSNPSVSPSVPNSGSKVVPVTVGVPEVIGRFDVNTVINNPA